MAGGVGGESPVDHERLVVPHEHDVPGGEVAVEDSLGVRMLNRLADPDEVAQEHSPVGPRPRTRGERRVKLLDREL